MFAITRFFSLISLETLPGSILFSIQWISHYPVDNAIGFAYYSVFLCSEKPNETLSTQAAGQPAFLAVYLVTIFLPEHDMEV